MKIIFVFLMLTSFVYSDEMKRIESIVKDIGELRADYEKCQNELDEIHAPKISAIVTKSEKLERLYQQVKTENMLLKSEINSNANLYEEIKELKKQLNFHKKLLISKNKTIENLKKKQLVSKNKFPKLIMKKSTESSTEIFKPASFHLIVDGDVYDGINGKKITKWNKNRSFTSNEKTSEWIKITGYFINKKWVAASKNMWIKLSDVSKK